MVARIKAVLRRCAPAADSAQQDGVIGFDNLSVDLTRYELKVRGKVVDAPPKELELLHYLASHPNRVLRHGRCMASRPWFRYLYLPRYDTSFRFQCLLRSFLSG